MQRDCFSLFLYKSLYELYYLNDGNDEEGKAEGDAVFHKVELSKAERFAKEVYLNDCGGKEQGEKSCAPEPLILSLKGEDGAVERTHIEGVEYLAHRKR